MSVPSTPTKGMGGRKLKAWEIAAQNPVDINKNMNDFLEHIKNEPLGPGLAAIAAQLTEMYEANDNEARQFTHNLQKKFQKECDGYQTDTAKFIEDLAMGLQTRIKSLEKGKPIPEDWPQQMEDWHNKQLSTFQLKLKQKKQSVTGSLGAKDSEAKKDRKAVFVDQERTLLKLFWEIKKSVDSKERTIGEVTAALALQTPTRSTTATSSTAVGRAMLPSTPTRRTTTTRFTSDGRTMLPSSPIKSTTTPSKRMGAGHIRTPSNKRQKTMDHYDLNESPKSGEL